MEGQYNLMKTRVFDIEARKLVAILNERDALDLGLLPLDRVEIVNTKNRKSTHCVVDISSSMVSTRNIGIFKDVQRELSVKNGDLVYVRAIERPESIEYIKKKMHGERLCYDEINKIVEDITKNVLDDIEMSAFMSAVYIRGFDLEETVSMTKALINNGKRIEIDKSPVVDKHSIGGTNGRATLIVVPILAAAGCYVPKTSSKAITSCAGTADSMEVLANVNLTAEQIKKTTEEIGAVIAWGGSVDLAPADDKIIRIEHPLSLDPEGQVVASVMAKKASVGSKYVVIDLPIGPDVKIKTKEQAENMAIRFIEVGKRLGIKVECLLTDGSEPCGYAFGPALEAKHALEILEGKIFDNLAQKSCELAGAILELTEKVPKGKGYATAKEILESKKALEKMKQIIKAQGGKIFSSEDIKKTNIMDVFVSKESGKIKSFNLRKLINATRSAGAPGNLYAGIILKVKVGDEISQGDVLLEVYAENRRKLEEALQYLEKNNPVELEKIVFGKISN